MTPLEIGRLIEKRRLSLDKGFIEVSSLRGINGYVPPNAPPDPPHSAKPPESEPPEWELSPLERLALVKLNDQGRAERIAALKRQYPGAQEYFRKYPLPPVFERSPPPPPPPPPEPQRDQPLQPIKLKSRVILLGLAVSVTYVAYLVTAEKPFVPVPVPTAPQPIAPRPVKPKPHNGRNPPRRGPPPPGSTAPPRSVSPSKPSLHRFFRPPYFNQGPGQVPQYPYQNSPGARPPSGLPIFPHPQPFQPPPYASQGYGQNQ